jgi:phospholipid/cholesterol/gamma-HCH transport system ATP-binding protein
VTCIVVTHQIRDAFYVATHRAVRTNGDIRIVEAASGEVDAADFLVLYEGRIHFEGSAAELLATKDAYVRELMEMTLPPW